MPKKSAPVRGGAQRSKPRVQKSFELVRPTSQELEEATPELEEQAVREETEAPLNKSTTAVATEEEVIEEEVVATERVTPVKARKTPAEREVTTPAKVEKPASRRSVSVKEKAEVEPVEAKTELVAPLTGTHPASKLSASARLAARRQASQRTSSRNANTLITSEHYNYVRKDLIFIAILAVTMFAILIILYFIPGLTL